MQALTISAEATSVGCRFPGGRVSSGVEKLGKRSLGFGRSSMPGRNICCGQRLGLELARARSGVELVFGSRAKSRWVRAQSFDGDLEDDSSTKLQTNSVIYMGVIMGLYEL